MPDDCPRYEVYLDEPVTIEVRFPLPKANRFFLGLHLLRLATWIFGGTWAFVGFEGPELEAAPHA